MIFYWFNWCMESTRKSNCYYCTRQWY